MPNPQRSRAARAALAAVALTVAVAAESTVNQALAQAQAHHTQHSSGRHHHQQAAGRPAPAKSPTPAKAPTPAKPGKPQSGPVFAGVPDRSVALGLPARLDPDGVTIDVGYPDAPVQMTLFEDYRCSETAKFEGRQGPMLRSLIARHRLLVHYVIESSLDERLPGPGAVSAADAARGALAHGGFALFHALLLANQGPEEVDGFTTDRLLALAATVPGLRSAAFDSEVRTLYWKPWIDAAQHLYDSAGVHHGTPSMLLNGAEVDLWAHPELLDDPAALQRFVENAANRGE
ncbi:DsbA family protein [Streptacidiphilus jiangxiensis]|uniref:Thioredoxin n=1 Tax=Streptacidiphilus jiangxiensis TaxID=235985 RepID=A0A1H7SMS7_STRJI|nr:thioredoxin domain-containing protein [Streptacidiphilus jiangxiensis]SEL72737.1 Thioredoxin [Streptacidiphilus jiangxiensis]